MRTEGGSVILGDVSGIVAGGDAAWLQAEVIILHVLVWCCIKLHTHAAWAVQVNATVCVFGMYVAVGRFGDATCLLHPAVVGA